MRRTLPATLLIALTLSCGSEPPSDQPVRAFGNEPFWNVTIGPDDIVYSRMGEPEVRFPYQVASSLDGGTQGYVYGPLADASGTHEIEIRIHAEECADTMADVVHPMRAIVVVDGEELAGCARPLDDPPPAELP